MIPRITIPDDFPQVVTGSPAEEKIKALGEVKIYRSKAETEEELIERLKESEVVISTRAFTHLGGKILASCPKLRLISILGTGTDNVDLKKAAELGITVANTPGANALAVAEHTVALLFALVRQIPMLDREVRSGQWPRVDMVQLSGKVMGLLGLGAIGGHVVRIVKGLGMETIAWTLHPSGERAEQSGVRFVSREELLKNSDVISLHLRLNDETRGFIKKEDFDRMKPSAFLVNTARAALVEPGALYEALRSRKIAGAALDVFDHEPLPPDDPLAALQNVVLTAHCAALTPEATRNSLMTAIENVTRFLGGKQIDPARLIVKGSR
ncbi:MAG: glycerate dehydrogenase [Deltaproteobacteria bacterium]|nr:glycerate dehydrogenase [Deltaproteobacteria bacterium]